MRAESVITSLATCLYATEARIAQAQNFQFVHPPSITAEDFTPPNDVNFKWSGPFVSQFNVKCWHADPNAPNVAIGGTDEWQTVTGFIPIVDVVPVANYRQTEFHSFRNEAMRAADMPSGIHVAFRAHTSAKILRVDYPARDPLPVSRGGSSEVGVLIGAEFWSTKTQGECYFAGAAWVASPR